MVTKRLGLQDQEEAFLLIGQHDKNIKELERRFGVQIFVRPGDAATGGGLALAIRGKPKSVDQAMSTLTEMKRSASRSRQKGHRHESVDVPTEGLPPDKGPGDVIYVTVTGKSI